MNIIVCLNFCPDANVITLDPEDSGRINEEDLIYAVHPSDLVAVEEAVKIKEANGSGKVTLVAMPSPSDERLLRKCLALGADDTVLINVPKFTKPDGHSIGALLAACCRTMDFDLILCGHGSLDNLGGQTGYVMADLLDLPIVSRVTKIDVLPEQSRLHVEKRLERGYREQFKLPLPALLTLEESLNEPRYASLHNMLFALEEDIKRLNEQDLNFPPEEKDLTKPKLKLIQIKTPKPRPKKIFTPDTSLSAEDRMWQIMSGGMDQKKDNNELFEGTPEELSSKFIDYLKQLEIEPFKEMDSNSS
jgi:electron transfer flavoprotein beta subunit